jgi:CBS domain-containing protein
VTGPTRLGLPPGRERWLVRRIGPSALVFAGIGLVLAGNMIAGMAMVAAGWTARAAVRAADRRDRLQSLVDGVTVGEVMETDCPSVPAHVTLDTFAPAIRADPGSGVVRVLEAGRFVGLVGPREVERVPRERWTTVRASEVMAVAAMLPGLAPGDPLGAAAQRVGASGATGLPVLQDGEPIGVLTRFAIGRAIQQRIAPGREAVGPADGG